jgi:predicted MFS family arabinose efflux permease
LTTSRAAGEWTLGWRIVLACAIANGAGISLTFYVFSMFLLPMSAEFGMTRSDTGLIQALTVTAALGAPLIGRMTDTLGFRTVFVGCALVLGLTGIAQGTIVTNPVWLGASVAVAAFFGSGNSSITLTKPVNVHFRRYRGRALGLVGIGVSITAILVPPLLHEIINGYGWRAGFLALSAFGLTIGLPLVLFLMPREAALERMPKEVAQQGTDWSFLRQGQFWLLALANMVIGIAASGAISQMSPMIQEEGLGAATAAWAISTFAGGQFAGKLVGGWLLDRFEPRLAAALLIVVPACGFAFLLLGNGTAWLALLSAGLIGFLQGADIDIFAYFTARKFGNHHYGTIFGAIHSLGWFGAIAGILMFSGSFDRLGSYAPAQGLSLLLLALGAAMILAIRLPPPEPRNL